MTDEAGWDGYVQAFHATHPGITEDLLTRAYDATAASPYAWLASAVPAGEVVDVACGSGPLVPLLGGRPGYLGLDLSPAELARARARGGRVVRADASRLPLPDASRDAVTVSMALMLTPLPATVCEAARVLRPGGTLAALLPVAGPLPWREALRWARLLAALRVTGLRYPGDALLADPAGLGRACGLAVASDETRLFTVRLRGGDADLLVDSLYVPGVPEQRVEAARRVAHRWTGTDVTLPLRRVVWVSSRGAQPPG